MSELIAIIISQFEKLTEKEKDSIATRLSRHFGKPLQFTSIEMSIFNEDELEIIRKTLNGLILTKENVPDILEMYERLKGMDLPSKISFGRLDDN